MTKNATVDIAIIGGGVAGLYTWNRLLKLGFSAILLESNALGSGQTLKSQGIIHGGIKYTLKGFLNSLATHVESMPMRWKQCLEGRGEVDLSQVKILSNEQLIWTLGTVSSEILGFFGSHILKSKVKKLKYRDYPKIFKDKDFTGNIWQLDEIVLDTHSLIQALIKNYQEFLYKIDPNSLECIFKDKNQKIESIRLKSQNENIDITAQHYIFAAGGGNRNLIPNSDLVKMQRRPIHMVMVLLPHPNDLFAHCMDSNINPRITITTHYTKSGKPIWYLGGQIAEDGIHRDSTEQIKFASLELKKLFPWINFENARYKTFLIDRCEKEQPGNRRPDSYFLKNGENFSIAWPTKLALAPLLSDQICEFIETQGIKPNPFDIKILNQIEKPKIGLLPWDEWEETLL